MRSGNPRIAIVGAGPQGLTAAAYLVHAGVDPADIVVFDPAGTWLSAWDRSFSLLGIDNLRSPSVHHPHPRPYALLEFARSVGRTSELVHTYGSPTTALFADFCSQVIDSAGLAGVVRQECVVGVSAGGEVTLAGGEQILADHVVWATNPAEPAPLPEGNAACVRWETVDLGRRSGTVAIVGGGLTAAHLVHRALEAEAHVEWLTRRPVEVREFDTDPAWLGPKEMLPFSATSDPRTRMDLVLAARGGGTVPPWMMARLDCAEVAGRVCRRVGTIEVVQTGDRTHLTVDGSPVLADRIWFATGDRPGVSASPPLVRLCCALDVRQVDGRPVLDTSLRLPGSVVHVMGRLAQLQLGPTAGNLAGARRGAELVVGAVVGVEAMHALSMW